jgi:hypothetical protein
MMMMMTMSVNVTMEEVVGDDGKHTVELDVVDMGSCTRMVEDDDDAVNKYQEGGVVHNDRHGCCNYYYHYLPLLLLLLSA